MKQSLSSLWKLSAAGISAAVFASVSILAQSAFYNGGNFQVDRPLDATSFHNAGTFSVSTFDLFNTRNTLSYTNEGTIDVTLGMEFLTENSSGIRTPATSIFNAQTGTINANGFANFDFGFPEGQGYSFGDGGYLNFSAANIINRGVFSVAYWGDLAVSGSNVDLRRSSLLTLQKTDIEQTQVAYIDPPQMHVAYNPPGVRGLNWGFYSVRTDLTRFATPLEVTEDFATPAGTVSVVKTNAELNLRYISSTTVPPTDPASDPTGWIGRVLSTATLNPNVGALTYIQTNLLSPTNNEISAVFIINRNPEVLASATVGLGQPLEARFGYMVTNNTDSSVDFRVVSITEDWSQTYPTNAPYAREYNYASSMMPRYVTIGIQPGIRIPVTREDRAFLGDPFDVRNPISRTNLLTLLGDDNTGANAAFTPLLFTDGYFDILQGTIPYTNSVMTNDYMSYEFSLTSLPSQIPSPGNSSLLSLFGGGFFPGSLGSLTFLPEIAFITNMAGRVRLDAANLDLRDTRIRASGVARIRADHVVSSRNTSIAAPFAHYDLGSTNGTLVYQGLNPIGQPNLNGSVRMMVMAWTNSADFVDPNSTDTNSTTTLHGETFFRVMVIDANFQPLETTGELVYLKLRATNLTTVDPIDFSIPDSTAVNTFFPGIDPAAIVPPFAEQVAPITENWSNESSFTVSGSAGVTPRSFPRLSNLFNSGLIFGQVFAFEARNGGTLNGLVNQGTIFSSGFLGVHATQLTNAGPIRALNVMNLSANRMTLAGATVNVRSGGTLTIQAGDLNVTSGGVITSPGLVVLDATNSFNANGFTAGPPLLTISGLGVRLERNAPVNNLQGVNVDLAAGRFGLASLEWPSEDRGPGEAGFANNSSLGALTLDVDEFGQILLSPSSSAPAALYVRRLELGPGFAYFIDVTNNIVDFDGLETALDIDPNFRLYYNVVTVDGIELNATVLDGAFNGRLRRVANPTVTGGSVVTTVGGGFSVQAPWSFRYSATIDSDGDGVVNAADATPFAGVNIATKVVSLNNQPYFEIGWNAAPGTSYSIMANEPAAGTAWTRIGSISNSNTSSKVLKFYDPMSQGTGAKTYRVVYTP
jgi:hypothetical protein